jgi:hypothetical protein
MKKAIKLMAMLLFAAILTTLVSCSKSNDNLIVGKWQCVSGDGQYYFFTDKVYEFKSDGTLITPWETIHYKVDGDVLSIIFSYTINYSIDELTSTEMTLSADFGIGTHYSYFRKI